MSVWPCLECWNIINRRDKTTRISGAFLKFSLISQWTWPLFCKRAPGPSLDSFVCVLNKSAPEWRRGRKQTLFELWVQCKHRQRTGPLCETEGLTNASRTANTPSCSECAPRARARANALVPVHNCGHIQIWRHTLSQCSLFNFHRYVNSCAEACIWCVREVYPKGEES